jgi:S1-C subfamily serine protease
MKRCPTCDQPVAEEIGVCPVCGQDLGGPRRFIDDYRIVDVLHDGRATFLCRAVREKTDEHVMIRLFKPAAGVTAEIAARLERELAALAKLPGEGFVRHFAIRRAPDGLWYRVSEWVEAESWGSLLASGRLADRRRLLALFRRTAEIMALLHRHGHCMPHLILNDIMPVPTPGGGLDVKIDYKLSRFIDPRLDRPPPMLKKLLSVHPDILNDRPLDFRSDIWSLGKVFVELLSGDLEGGELAARLAGLGLPEGLERLLRLMLAEDPDLRPQSMEEVAAALARIAGEPAPGPPPPEQGRGGGRPARAAGRRALPLLLAAALFALAAFSAWRYFGRGPQDAEALLESYANRYARAVAFVAVEYWVEAGGETFYRNLAEGTAFLADREGYLLTSRHVVCPWLEDPRVGAAAQFLRMRGRQPVFGHRIYLWFEGRRAFNPAARFIDDPEVADVYFTENAYSSEASPRVGIAGVAKPPVRARQVFTSPLRDDFAVIRIEGVPPGAEPLPLDLEMDPAALPKLSRVIALGFPLGSRTQADTVNASVVRGNVRRAFRSMFQIDASLHSGNSGGPVIDARGRVIGIVAAVAVELTQGMMPTATPVWDIGLILPITDAVRLLIDIKAGQTKWNGVIDFAAEADLARVRGIAAEGRFAEAMAAADAKLGTNPQPALVAASGLMHLCAADYGTARLRFRQSLSMDPDDHASRLMLALIDRLAGGREAEPYAAELAKADWRSPAEFQGYLYRLLEGRVAPEAALKAGLNAWERDWLKTVAAVVRLAAGRAAEAAALLEEVVLAADTESWAFFLARAKLEELRRGGRPPRAGEDFERRLRENLEARRREQEKTAPLAARLAGGGLAPAERREVLEALAALDPGNLTLAGTLAWASAAVGDFDRALSSLRRFQEASAGGRVTAMRLSSPLLEAGIRHHRGEAEESRRLLQAFIAAVEEPGFRAAAEFLDGRLTEEALRREIGDSPEMALAAFAAAGFRAEGSQDRRGAMRFYREALGTFLDERVEYDFVRERVRHLKRQPEG